MTFPASVRGAMTIMSLARSLREYVRAKDQSANPSVIDSVVESFKLVGAYSGMIRNTQRIREEFVDNPYRAAAKVGKVMKANLGTKKDLMEAIAYKKSVSEPFTQEMLGECRGEYACFKD